MSEFDKLAMGAIHDAMSDSSVAKSLSPIVSIGANVYQLAGEYGLLDGEISGADAAKVGIDLGKEILAHIEPMVRDAIGDFADAIPLVGQVVGIITTVANAPPAALSSEEYAQGRANQCAQAYKPVIGTGVGGTVKPADIFHSSIGDALEAIGEYGTESLIDKVKKAAKVAKIKGTEKWGIPSKVRNLLKSLRLAIIASEESGDDASVIWMLYLDTLRNAEKLGQMVPVLADFLVAYKHCVEYSYASVHNTEERAMVAALLVLVINNVDELIPPVHPDMCRSYDNRPIKGALEVMRNWKLTVEPMWKADKKALKASIDSILSQADGAMATKLRLVLLANALKEKQRIKLNMGGKKKRIKLDSFGGSVFLPSDILDWMNMIDAQIAKLDRDIPAQAKLSLVTEYTAFSARWRLFYEEHRDWGDRLTGSVADQVAQWEAEYNSFLDAFKKSGGKTAAIKLHQGEDSDPNKSPLGRAITTATYIGGAIAVGYLINSIRGR